MRDISPAVGIVLCRAAHEELRDIYVAAITAARNFSRNGKPDQSAEAMGLACELKESREGDRHTPPFEWPRWPFVLDIRDVAQILRRSVTSIRRELAAGSFPILPMPRHGKTAAYRWSRVSVQRHVESAPIGTSRKFFSKGRAARARVLPTCPPNRVIREGDTTPVTQA